MRENNIGLLGIKLGMSRVFNKQGASIPVTVVYADINRVCQVKTKEKDGYAAVQVAAGTQKSQRVSKALRGHYDKAQVPLGRRLSEFRINNADVQPDTGGQVTVRHFVVGQKVDLTGVSKGRGFAGGVKRWNFAMQDATHGNSLSHRHLGSTGQCQFPGRVFKGKKMAGHYGAERVTVMRLEVVDIDEENRLIFIKGAVPGSRGGWVIIRPSAKETLEERKQADKSFKERDEQQQTADEGEKEAEAEAEAGADADADTKETPKEKEQSADADKAKKSGAEADAKGDAKEPSKEKEQPASVDADADKGKDKDKKSAKETGAKGDTKDPSNEKKQSTAAGTDTDKKSAKKSEADASAKPNDKKTKK